MLTLPFRDEPMKEWLTLEVGVRFHIGPLVTTMKEILKKMVEGVLCNGEAAPHGTRDRFWQWPEVPIHKPRPQCV